jgi:hypothetical protein
MNGRTPIAKTDDLDILSGIWIMSCNDDNPIMTYKSIAQRLNLPDTYDVKAVVRSRPELFRPGILNSRLNAWKDLMRSGKSRPNWIVEIHDQTQQRKAIDQLTRDDVFRNQFRVGDGAGKCDIEVIDWGLQHIERLRKAAAEEREARSRKWTSIIIPLASLFVAAVSVVGTVWVQWHSTNEQQAAKHYEVEFAPKQRAYSSFMVAFDSAVTAVGARDQQDFAKQVLQMESAFFSLEPFLKKENRADLRVQYLELVALCNSQMNRPLDQSGVDKEAFLTKATAYSLSLKNQLYNSLFDGG